MSDLGQFIRGKRFTKADYEDAGIPCIHYGEIYTHFGTSATSVVSHLRRDIASGLSLNPPMGLVLGV